MKYTLIDGRASNRRGVGVLYRQNNAVKAYSVLRPGVSPMLDIQTLTPETEYEIKVATLRTTEFPGIFRTVTSRTFGKKRLELRLSLALKFRIRTRLGLTFETRTQFNSMFVMLSLRVSTPGKLKSLLTTVGIEPATFGLLIQCSAN